MEDKGIQKHCDMRYRISGKIPNHANTHIYFVIQCYYKFTELNESYETRGSDFMQAIEHRLYPVSDPVKNAMVELELFTMFFNIWSVIGVPKGDFEQIKELAVSMGLGLEKGINQMSPDFPVIDKGNVWTVTRVLKNCRLISKGSE